MQRKIFIAINLDQKTKKFIESKISKWKEQLPIRWTRPENLHITVVYLGFINDDQLSNICSILRNNLRDQEAFDIVMNHFCQGPNDEKPKMAWLKGKKNKKLSLLRKIMENSISGFEADEKEFSPHITIGRIRRLNQKNIPLDLDEMTNIIIPVSSVEVMESVYEKGRRKYFVMESIGFA